MRTFLLRCAVFAVLFPALSAPAAIVDVMLERIRKSEFVFGRVGNNAPFPPVAWVGMRSYGDSQLTTTAGEIQFEEIGVTQALIAPVWIGKTDMVLLGEYFSWQQVDITSPRSARLNITTVMPVAAWLRQVGPRTQFAAFVTPEFVNGSGYDDHGLDKYGGYAGAIMVHWSSDTFAWFYGAVGLFAPGDDTFLPYLGFFWQPSREWTVSMVLPWPTISYAPSPNYMFQLGLVPAEAALTTGESGQNLRVSYDSWNLQLSAHRRIATSFWASAGVGWSGFGSFSVKSDGNSEVNSDLKRSAVWFLQISLRPPTNWPATSPRAP